MMGMGEKNPENKKGRNPEKIPRLVALTSPCLRKVEADCFPGVWKHQKQAGPTLG